MLSDLNLKINNIGPIAKANLDIGKINVIGGLNATGKSTASKLLYCLLKGGTINRQEFAYSLIEPKMFHVIRMAKRSNLESFIEDESEELFKYHDNVLDQYFSIRKEILNKNIENFSDTSFYSLMQNLDKQINVIEENGDKLYYSLLRNLLSSEFSRISLKGNITFNGKFNNNYFQCSANFMPNNLNFSSEEFFLINDVIYVDTVSILDSRRMRRNGHIAHLDKYLFESNDYLEEFLDDELYKKINVVENKINSILQGKFGNVKRGRLSFKSENGHETPISEASSGMKQIGVIQILLANRRLKENSFLIIDEPEVNLHPEWQIKLAEIFVLLASELNIYVYINSHSPMFIEAMSIFSEYYNLQDETNFYLTKKVENENGYFFKEIAYDNMGAVYENLARPYMELDQFKAKIAHNNLGD